MHPSIRNGLAVIWNELYLLKNTDIGGQYEKDSDIML